MVSSSHSLCLFLLSGGRSEIESYMVEKLTKEQVIEQLGDIPFPQELSNLYDREGPQAVIDYIANKEEKNRKELFPCKDFIPNIGQERALKGFLQKHPDYGDFPKITIMLGGNGVGKTADAIALIAGVTLGPEFLNAKYFPHDYFKETAAIRKIRPFRMRIVCDAADMEASGSVYEQLSEWLPIAEPKHISSGRYYTKIYIPAPSKEYHPTIIDIKTFKQEKVAHAGSNLDLIIFNEPPPKDIFNENVGRIRRGGRIVMFLTPLDLAAYLCKVIDDTTLQPGELYTCKCSIWDNCRDEPGTRGVLSRREIENQIRLWEATDPTEVAARERGEFQHLAGSIFKLFSEDVHVIDPKTIAPDWNIYQIVDHHPVKPPFAVWLAVTPWGDKYVIAEYPTVEWDKIIGTPLTIRDFGIDFKRIENGEHEDFGYIRKLNVLDRFGDPNAFKARLENVDRTIQEQYDLDCGLWYNIAAVDNNIALRINEIKTLIGYDFKRQRNTSNRPRLYVYSSCRNTIRAMKYFAIKKALYGKYVYGSFEEEWECPIAALGYGLTTIGEWTDARPRADGGDDYLDIVHSRTHPPVDEEFEPDPHYREFKEFEMEF